MSQSQEQAQETIITKIKSQDNSTEQGSNSMSQQQVIPQDYENEEMQKMYSYSIYQDKQEPNLYKKQLNKQQKQQLQNYQRNLYPQIKKSLIYEEINNNEQQIEKYMENQQQYQFVSAYQHQQVQIIKNSQKSSNLLSNNNYIEHKQQLQLQKKQLCSQNKIKIQQQIQINCFQIFNFYIQENANITGYDREFFLKIQTQLYQIQIKNKSKQIKISRRFSDFTNLHKIITFNYPGIIIYPFPQSSVQFFTKVKCSYGSEIQKVIMIEKRLLQLQDYINFVLSHPTLKNSIEVQVFLQQSSNIYNIKMNQILQKVDNSEKQLTTYMLQKHYNSIKKVLNFGLSYFGWQYQNKRDSLMYKQLLQKHGILTTIFYKYKQQINKIIQSLKMDITLLQKILKIYQKDIRMHDCTIDSVLILGSKINSSKMFNLNMKKHLSSLQDIYQFLLNTFSNIQIQIDKNINYLDKIVHLQQKQQILISKLVNKVQNYHHKFKSEWTQLLENYINIKDKISKYVNIEWKKHCLAMLKIWK